MDIKKKLIDYTFPFSENEAKILFEEISKKPMAKALVELFKYIADPQTLRKGEESFRNSIYAEIKNPEINFSMSIRNYKSNNVGLEMYVASLQDIFEYEVSSYKFVSISTEPSDLGGWAYGKGHLKRHEISVWFSKPINLPSKAGKWFFDLMKWFSLICSELYLNVNEQQKFWVGDKEKP